MTALFVVMFLDQWRETDRHAPALTGLGCSLLCLLLLGSERFLIPAMALIVACFLLQRKAGGEAAA